MKHQQQVTDTVMLGSGYHDARALTAALVEHLERSLADGVSLENPEFGLPVDGQSHVGWSVRAADVDVRLMTIAFGV